MRKGKDKPKLKTVQSELQNDIPVSGAPVYPKKNERSPTETSERVEKDNSPPPELAKVFTPGEAKQILAMNLKPIQTRWISVKIAGDDLITHRWSEKAVKEMLASQMMTQEQKKIAKRNRAAKNPEEEFQGARYHWDGKDWFPVNGIKKAMGTAAYDHGIAKSIVRRSLFVIGEKRRDYVEIKYARIVKREDAVRVGQYNNRTADLRYRPEYQGWSALLRIKYRSDIITAEQVVMLLQYAGFGVGIGEWRPEKEGQAGTFEVETVPVVTTAGDRMGMRHAG
jgi:hypothetical protein